MNKYKVLLLLCAAFSLLVISMVGGPALAQRVVTKAETKGEKDKLSAPVRADVAAPIRAHIGPAQISRSQAQVARSPIRPSRTIAPNSVAPLPGPNYIVELEPNNTPATAQNLGTNLVKQVKGTIQPGTDVDYYSFGALAGDRVYAATQTSLSSGGSGLTGDSTIELYSTDGTTVLEADNNDGTFDATASSIAGTTLPTDGMYFIKVRHSSGAPASEICPYDLYLRLQFVSPIAETEPNNNAGPPNTPTPVAASGYMSGVINPAADNDVYSIDLDPGDTVFISLDANPERDGTTWNPRIAFGLFDNFFLVADDANITSPNSEAFFFTVREAGTYLIYVDEPAGGGAATDTYRLSVTIHAAEGFRTCTTYTSTNVPQAIPVAAGLATSTLSIPDSKRIGNLQVSLNITHSALGELDVSLMAPDGNEVVLFDDPPAAAAGTTVPQINFTLDDEAGVPTASFGINKSMIFQPESLGRLTWFKNQNSLGTWRLNVRDDAGVGSGSLNGWSVTVCEDPPIPFCNVPDQAMYSSDFESNNGGFTHSGTGDEWEYGQPSFAPITTCHSGTKCWKTDLDNTYNNAPAGQRIDQELVSPNIDLSTRAGQRITFKWAMKYQIEGSNWDNAYVEVREVGGSGLIKRVWEWAGPTMTGSVGSPAVLINSAAGWGTWETDISEFGGKTVRLVFHLDQDDSVNLAGLAIDDVFVAACRVSGPLPDSAVSRKTHAPNAGVFDIPMPITGTPGIECRTGGATNDHTMVVTFPTAVVVGHFSMQTADVTNGVGDVGTGGVPNGGTVSGSGTPVITVPLTNVANAQTIIVTLFDVDDFTNPRGNVSIPMSVLLGDTSDSGGVTGTDVSQTKLRSGQAVNASTFRSDVIANGAINGTDVSSVKLKSGTGLP